MVKNTWELRAVGKNKETEIRTCEHAKLDLRDSYLLATDLTGMQFPKLTWGDSKYQAKVLPL